MNDSEQGMLIEMRRLVTRAGPIEAIPYQCP